MNKQANLEEFLKDVVLMHQDAKKTWRKDKEQMYQYVLDYVEKYGLTGLESWLKQQQTNYGRSMQFGYVEACKDVLKLLR